MSRIKAIIVDDEKRARENLKLKIADCNFKIDIVAEADCVEDALIVIEENNPDLLFLDIAMPRQSGFDLIKQIPKVNFEIIFATAFDSFALTAFEINAIGYILKPINIDKLKVAIANAISKIDLVKSNDEINSLMQYLDQPKDILKVHSSDSIEMRELNEVVRLESDGGYTKIFFRDGSTVLSSSSLGSYETQLVEKSFFRVHRGHLINTSFFRSYKKSGYIILKDGTEVPLSKRKKNVFLKIIG